MTPSKLIVLLFGAGFLADSARGAWRNHQARGWPVATGLVTRSELHPDGDAIELLYEYDVDGRTYHSQRLCYLKNDEMVASAARMFPVGSRPEVRFDPRDPSRATLLCVASRAGLYGLAFPVLFIAAVSLS